MTKTLILILLLSSNLSMANNEAVKNTDQELSKGAKKMKSGAAFNHKSKKTGNKVKDGLNNVWDSGLSAVGKVIK